MKYFEVNALGNGWSYTALVRSSSKVEAEKEFRSLKRFRRTARQNGEEWRSIPLVVDPITVKAFVAGSDRPDPEVLNWARRSNIR